MSNIISTGMHGMLAQNEKLNWIGHNIANMRTPGYRSHDTFLAEMSRHSDTGSEQAPGVTAKGVSVNWSASTPTDTDRPTDLAIQGEGMFPVVQGGKTFFTRAGNFSFNRNDDRSGFVLSRPTGERLADSTGNEISFGDIPANFSISPNGAFQEMGTASPSVPEVRLQLFANPETLRSVGNGLYEASTQTINHEGQSVQSQPKAPVEPGANGSGQLRQGALETSNVELVNEFSNLLQAQRIYQANSRAVSTGNKMLQNAIQNLL